LAKTAGHTSKCWLNVGGIHARLQKEIILRNPAYAERLASGNFRIARAETVDAWKSEYALSRQLGRERPGGPHAVRPRAKLQSHSGMGLFLRFCTTHCSGHFRSIRSKINAACLIAFSTTANFAGLTLSESMSISFRAQSSVAAKRIAYFLSSVIGFPAHWIRG